MPLIMPIKDLRNTVEISEFAHKEREPVFITKNGYSGLVVMSNELYDSFAREIAYAAVEKPLPENARKFANRPLQPFLFLKE